MRINETHRAYDALQYPLMFFGGEDGCQINIPKRHETTKIPLSKTVSASEFYSYQIMERHDKTRPESIDKVICAELTDFKLDPALYEIIRSTMIHGPCGYINKSSPCMLNVNCTKNIQGASRRKLKQEKMDIPSIVEDLRKTVE
ncbi:helitron_like_N domain-containing protein [Trichonephila clavipes]|nr:helitron_like_N domain-containing protein [Trichonephila clavipes]